MELIERILAPENLTGASKEVIRNKGAGGIDGMKASDLKKYLDSHRSELAESVRNCRYLPQPIRGKEIPKGNGKTRLLGIPTVIDRMLQQAVLRVIMPKYEYEFSSYSFRLPAKTQLPSGSMQSTGLNQLGVSTHCGN